MAGRGQLRLKALGWRRLRTWWLSQGVGEGETGERSFYVGWGVRDGQRMKRPEMERVTEGSGIRR